MARPDGPRPTRFLGVGMELAGVIAVMAWLGWAFDEWRGTKPWGVIIGSSLGIVGGLYNLIKTVVKENQRR